MLKIRAAGWQPTLEDYHFVLEQFAAVGYHVGMAEVYKELIHFGLQPRTTTYGLCLQAIAHRLALPFEKLWRQKLLEEARKMCGNLMNDMRANDIPFTSVNLDLAMRILKETSDEEGFNVLLKSGYGIDLAFPDRPPLYYPDSKEVRPGMDNATQKVPSLQPFSTAALNTTVDMLGRFGNVSKLVQAFEVLTQPLPPQASQHFSSSFDDEDDDYSISSNPPSTQKYQLPHAKPNTTTYNMLLRHISRAGHAVFARHYLNQAMELDRITDRRLRGDLLRKPFEKVLAPHFAINRGTLLSVFGEANRDKNTQLMRWLWSKFPKIIRRKKNDLEWYTNLHARVQGQIRASSQLGEGKTPLKESSAISIDPTRSTTRACPDEPTVPIPTPPTYSSSANRPKEIGSSSAFDVDLDGPDVPSPPPIKYFDITLHLEILQRDIEQIENYEVQVRDVLGRTTQRVKERLGRRVWAGKTIYLLTDIDRRRKVSREAWRDIVHFKPRSSVGSTPSLESQIRQKAGARYASPGWLAGHRGDNPQP
jgi:hypothetical protein